MLPSRMRLSRAAFGAAAKGRRYTSEHLSATLQKTQNGGCAAVISKKVAKLSVERHALKRRLLTLMRPWCTGEYAIVVYARAGAPSLSYTALQKELTELLTKFTA